MKKFLAVFLAFVMCLMMTACGSSSGEDDVAVSDSLEDTESPASIAITKENYTDYLNVEVEKKGTGVSYVYEETSETLYSGMTIAFWLTGDATKYAYENVELTLEYSITYSTLYENIWAEGEVPPQMGDPHTETLTVNVEITNEGDGFGCLVRGDGWRPAGYYVTIDSMTVEVIGVSEISGHVRPL